MEENEKTPWGEKRLGSLDALLERPKRGPTNSRVLAYLGVALLILFMAPGVVYMGGVLIFGEEDHTFDEQRDDGMKAAIQLLIAGNICASKNDCYRKDIIFCSPKALGFSIEIYEISDRDLLEKIARVFTEKFYATSGMMQLQVRAYSITKQQDMARPFWKTRDETLHIEMKRSKQ